MENKIATLRENLLAAQETNDITLEIKLLRSLIELGDGGAMFELGTIYIMGEKVPQNLDDASFYLSMAANKNNTSAQCYLGQLYLFGGLGELDYEKAYAWLSKSSESDYTSRYLLGYIFYSGLGHEVDYVEELGLFSYAAFQAERKKQMETILLSKYTDWAYEGE